jgi:ElaB/YqjD/DUF883 family membrane-anchored ribosome-binding protein
MAITIPILTDFDGRGIDRGIKQFGQLETKGQKAGFLIKKAALPAAAALAGLGAAAFVSAKAAAEDAAAQDKLAGTLQRVTGASDAVVASTEDYITTLSQAVGVADDELRPALGKLATVTRDVGKAQELLGIALDVSAQTGKPLEAVTTGLAKAYGGNLGALKKLIPGFDEGIIKSKDFEAAQAELAKLTGGAASESANTAAGQFRRFGIAIEETKESIGAALLPIIQAFLPILQRMAAFVQENSGVVVALGAAVGALSIVVLAVNAAMKVAAATTAILTAAQIAYNIALSANPIGVVVLAVAALVAAFVTAYKTSDTFREIVDGLFGALRGAFTFVRDTVGPIIAGFVKALKSAFEWIKENAGPALDVLETAFKTAFAPIALAISGMQTLLKLLGSWDKGPRGVPNLTRPGAGSGGMRGNEIPAMAMGGIVRQPTLAFIGEAGPEAVIPLSRMGGMGGITINVEAGLVSTPDQVGQQIIEAIQRAQRRSGPAFAAA